MTAGGTQWTVDRVSSKGPQGPEYTRTKDNDHESPATTWSGCTLSTHHIFLVTNNLRRFYLTVDRMDAREEPAREEARTPPDTKAIHQESSPASIWQPQRTVLRPPRILLATDGGIGYI